MRSIGISLLAAAALSACATTGDRASIDPRDPYEGVNRGVWAFNDAVDKAVLKPATTVYRTVTPVPARRGVSRVFANLAEPFSFINNLLQGKPKRAFNSLGRFVINSTIGVGGLADHATDLGLPETQEDFGQTLAVSGAKRSPYLVLPLFGPSTARDALGRAVQFVADPAQIVIRSELHGTERLAVSGVELLDVRSTLIETGADSLLDGSADPYAAARSAYFQRRDAQILDNEDGLGEEVAPGGEEEPAGAVQNPEANEADPAPVTEAPEPEAAAASD